MSAREFAHHFADFGEVTIHYVTAGAGLAGEPPIVLLHGWPQTWYEWREVIPRLAAHHRVIAPDLRGLGDSSRPLDGYDKRTVAGDIFRLLAEHLGLERWHCVGHDWGGPVTYALGALHPESMLTMTIIDVDCYRSPPVRAAVFPLDRSRIDTTKALRPRHGACSGNADHSAPRGPFAVHCARSSSNITIPARRATNTPPPAQTKAGASRSRYQAPSLR